MRINFTQSTLSALKLTANCSYANAVYKLTMKAQQGLKCDDIYKKSVLMHEVNKLLCKYKLATSITFQPAIQGEPSVWTFDIVNNFTAVISYYLIINGENILIGEGNSVPNLVDDINNNTETTGVTAEILFSDESFYTITITSPIGCFNQEDISYSIDGIYSEDTITLLSFIKGQCPQNEVSINYTEEELNCIKPDDLQKLYEFTHKYKETISKSKQSTTSSISSTSNSKDCNCCTWGEIDGNIGNQSDLLNYLDSIQPNTISIDDDGDQITNDVKNIDFVGGGVVATSDSNGNVTVTIPGGSEPAIYDANNGLTQDPSNNFKLGGTLIETTTINTDDNILKVETSALTNAPLQIRNTNSNSAADGITVYSEEGVAGVYEINHTNCNNTFPILELKRGTSSTCSESKTGLGGSIDFYLKNNSNNYTTDPNGKLTCIWTNATALDSGMEIYTFANSSQTKIATFNSDSTKIGQINFNKYGQGDFTQTPQWVLGVTPTGDIVESEYLNRSFKLSIPYVQFGEGGQFLITDVVAPGTGKAISVIEASLKISGPKDWDGEVILYLRSTSKSNSESMFNTVVNTFFQNKSSGIYKMADTNTNTGILINNIVENDTLTVDVNWTTPPSFGTCNITVYGSYRIIDL